MNTLTVAYSSRKKIFTLGFSLSFCAAAACWGASPSETGKKSPETAKAKADHVLFMGADFDVEQNHHFWRVEGVSGASFIIHQKDEKIFVPMNRGAISMKVLEELKLSASSANVSGFTAERGYSDQTDPRKKFMREDQGAALMANDELAEKKFNSTFVASTRRPSEGGPPSAAPGAISAAQMGAASSDYSSTSQISSGFDQSSGAGAGRMQQELAKENFDAMDVTFTVSSPKLLANPYVVLVAQYRERGEKAGIAHSWIYAQELRAIDGHPRAERILQGGLPEGFELRNCEFHLYNNGSEVATTVSPKRVTLTREEAFEYILIDYVSSHKGATLPAVAAMGEIPPDLYTKTSADQIRANYFVTVSADGVPLGVYSDEACTKKVSDPIESVILALRFKPTLEKGKAVQGVAKVRLNNLSLQI